ncbi:MAG: hypothetical protein QW812_05140 [Thermoplasmataceae archaeon]
MASNNPPYIGIITVASDKLWNALSLHRNFTANGLRWDVRYRIEVGESTIFFATSSDAGAAEIFKPG